MGEQPTSTPPADRPANEAGAAKARDFADKVQIGHAERKFRARALELVALHLVATRQSAELAATLKEIGATLEELMGGAS